MEFPFPVSNGAQKFLMMRVAHLLSFIDAIQWWKVWKEVLPVCYQMAMDKLGTPRTTSTPPSDLVNIMASHAFTTARQFLLTDVFIKPRAYICG